MDPCHHGKTVVHRFGVPANIAQLAWALVCTLMGIVKSYHGLLAARAALGIAEGGLFPGVTYYITMWYRRHECGLRIAVSTLTLLIPRKTPASISSEERWASTVARYGYVASG